MSRYWPFHSAQPTGKVADLIAAGPEVPRLGDQLHLRQHRVLRDDVEEGAELVDLVQLARQRRREVEAEAVDVHLEHPVAQAVHDELDGARVEHVQAVAAAGEVDVAAPVVGVEPVVRRVVDAAQRERRTALVAFAGVVVDHVEDHLDAGAVQALHHGLELADLLPAPSAAKRTSGAKKPIEL